MALKITGTMLVPGVSRNKRLYTKELISKATARMADRIDSGSLPITMLTHHEAEDDSLRIVGHLTEAKLQPDGSTKFAADLDDTPEGRGIYNRWHAGSLKSVSIRGWWLGETRNEYMGADVGQVTTADDLEIDGLDFTKSPGVSGALLDAPSGKQAETVNGRTLITESVEITAFTESVEVDMSQPNRPAAEAATLFADNGYLADGKKRYPIGTRETAVAAWQHFADETNTGHYSAPQMKRIKERIGRELGKHNVTVDAKEHWLIEKAAPVTVGEFFADYPDYPDRNGSFCVNLSNGPLNISVSSWCVDPAELDAVARAAMAGACAALAALDPDMDGDIDKPAEGASAKPDDDSMESTNLAPSDVAETEPAKRKKNKKAATENTDDKEPTVAKNETTAVESATPAAPAGGIQLNLTDEQFKAWLAAQAPAAATTEAAPAKPAVEETEEQRIDRIVAARIAEASKTAEVVETDDERIERLAEARYQEKVAETQARVERTGPPVRKGVQRPIDEHSTTEHGTGDADINEATGMPASWGNKQLHEMSSADLRKKGQQVLIPWALPAISGQ